MIKPTTNLLRLLLHADYDIHAYNFDILMYLRANDESRSRSTVIHDTVSMDVAEQNMKVDVWEVGCCPEPWSWPWG